MSPRQQRVQETLRLLDKRDGQPCIGCECSAACADLELACRAFRGWIQGSKRVAQLPREPSRRLFLLTMTGEDET